MRCRAAALGAAALLVVAGCSGDGASSADGDAACPEPATTPFVEVSCPLGFPDEALGRDEVVHNFAGGASVADYDGDGWLDVYVTRSIGPDRLYRNIDGRRFDDVTAEAGVDGDHPSGASVWADVDGDGCLDLYVTSVGADRNHLFMSNCAGGFREEAEARGVALPTDELTDQFPSAQSFGAAFGDVDRDGDVDLFVGQWRLREHDTDELPARNRFFRNDGTGHFADATAEVGLAGLDASVFTPTFVDVDGDGWDDLLLAADFGTSRVFLSDHGERFVDRTSAMAAGTDENGMGSVVADLDGDGRLDWFVTSIFRDPAHCDPASTAIERCSGNRLYLGTGDAFVDATDRLGLREGYWGWGAAGFDVDRDGDLDLGMTDQSPAPGQGIVGDPNRLWRNDDGRFVDVAAELGVAGGGSGKSFIPFDYDRDGDLDLLVSTTYGGIDLYRNDLAPDRHWLTVRPHGPDGGVGAVVTVQAEARGPVQRQDVRAGDTYLGSRPLEAFFGLADHAGPVHRVTVVWPDTREETVLQDVAPDRVLDVDPG